MDPARQLTALRSPQTGLKVADSQQGRGKGREGGKGYGGTKREEIGRDGRGGRGGWDGKIAPFLKFLTCIHIVFFASFDLIKRRARIDVPVVAISPSLC